MTWVDIAILVLLVAATFGGFRQGFIVQVAAILGAVIALAVARNEYPNVRAELANIAPHSQWLTVIAYLGVFLLVWAAILIVARRIRGVARLLALGWLDRGGGMVIGLLQGVLLVELLIALGKRLPKGDLRHAVNHAALTPLFGHLVPYVDRFFPHA